MTSRATGAANAAPWPGTPCERHGDRHPRVGRGGEGDEPHVVDRVTDLRLGGAGLARPPGCPGSAPSVPVPSLTTASIIEVTAVAVDGFITTDCTRGVIVAARCALRRRRSGRSGAGPSARPRLATAAATSAICSGRHLEFVLADAHAPDVHLRAGRREQRARRGTRRWSDISSARIVELRLAVEAEAAHVARHRRLAELSRRPAPRRCSPSARAPG